MPDGSEWAVPVAVIARHRAAYYAAREFGGDVERSLAEDTMPLFETDSYEVHDWAANNMRWEMVKDHARQVEPAAVLDFEEDWCNGRYRVDVMNGDTSADQP
jgi:hypothetical protein